MRLADEERVLFTAGSERREQESDGSGDSVEGALVVPGSRLPQGVQVYPKAAPKSGAQVFLRRSHYFSLILPVHNRNYRPT